MTKTRITDLAADHLAAQLEAARRGRSRRRHGPGSHWRNHASVSVGCDPADVSARNDELKRKGINGVRFKRNGQLKVDSLRAQRAYCREFGFCNRDDNG